MDMMICNHCGEVHYKGEKICPHCNSSVIQRRSPTSTIAILLGLGLVGCDNIKSDPQPLYGVALDSSDIFIDEDGDGYMQDEDCDDQDANIHPEADETPEDGIDSNCNNEDDT